MHAMEEVSGDDLQAFFDQWLRRGGNPALEGSWSYNAGAGVVRVELRQVQGGGLFAVPLEIGVYGEGDLVPAQVTTVEVSEASHRFEIAVEGEPVDVRLDPGTWLLFRGEFLRHQD